MKRTSYPPLAATTGHSEIDAQHEQLNDLTDKLGMVCVNYERTGGRCIECPPECHASCTDRLADLICELLAFMVEHFHYEEALMRLLPDTELCKMHIEAHKIAHAEVSRSLSELTTRLDQENPRACSLHLQEIINGWMGSHTLSLDCSLATELEKAYGTEMSFDVELAQLLTH